MKKGNKYNKIQNSNIIEITEKEIAKIFFGSIVKNVDLAWPEIYKQLKGVFDKEYGFEIENEDAAQMNLSFAVIAIEMQALKNFFPDQAESICSKVINCIGLPEDREHIKYKIDLYQDKLRESTEQYTKNDLYSPFEEVAVQLVHDWFGDKVDKFYVKNTQVVNPVLAGVLNTVLISFIGFWKKTKDDFIIIDNDLTDNKHKQNPVIFDMELTEGHYPILRRRALKNPEMLEREIKSVANAWHEGDAISAMQALESDLEHSG